MPKFFPYEVLEGIFDFKGEISDFRSGLRGSCIDSIVANTGLLAAD